MPNIEDDEQPLYSEKHLLLTIETETLINEIMSRFSGLIFFGLAESPDDPGEKKQMLRMTGSTILCEGLYSRLQRILDQFFEEEVEANDEDGGEEEDAESWKS